MSRVRGRALGVLLAAAAVVGGVVVGVGSPVAGAVEAPGTVVSTTPLAAGELPGGAASGYQVLYASTGVGGASTTVSGLVYLPEGAAPAGGWPVLSWAHGTTGLGDSCAPTVTGSNRLAYLTGWLDAGYAVVATDYAGLGTPGGHPYLDGRVAAYGVIDIVRAARAVTAELSPHWFAVGQSQGGHAAMFTAHVAGRYAPELDFRGAVAHGVPSNLSYFVSLIGPTFPPSLVGLGTKTLIAYILAGLEIARPDFDLASYLTPLGKSVVADAHTLCGVQLAARVSDVNLADMFTKDLGDPFRQAWGAVFDVPVTGYDRPLLIAQGDSDAVVPPSLTSRLVGDLAANSQPHTYKTYPSDHTGTPDAALPDALVFAEGLFDGVTPAPDTTPPTGVTAAADRAPDSGGWFTKPFTATWSGTDPSGIAECTTAAYSGPDTATGSLSGSCTDKAGNVSAPVPFAFRYDATAPSAKVTAPAGLIRSGTQVGGTAADAVSGVAAVTVTAVNYFTGRRTTHVATCATDCATWRVSTSGLHGFYTLTATPRDAAGNTGPASPGAFTIIL
ncbi:lipase family protein [Actinokineospora iranica]|uniref:lipase family protein n=1 Tax=Actinokineospora iranica TaxID=1271860 RepID=UPI001E3A263D|nr:lipase family protein [Actinokineospora iranica]